MTVNLLRILPLVCVPLAIAVAAPLEIDPNTGQYRDLSYAALAEEGLSPEERTRLFGGETIHYGELIDGERTAAQRTAELAALTDLLSQPYSRAHGGGQRRPPGRVLKVGRAAVRKRWSSLSVCHGEATSANSSACPGVRRNRIKAGCMVATDIRGTPRVGRGSRESEEG